MTRMPRYRGARFSVGLLLLATAASTEVPRHEQHHRDGHDRPPHEVLEFSRARGSEAIPLRQVAPRLLELAEGVLRRALHR